MTALDIPDIDDDVDLDFAARAATYLREQGLDRQAVALALRTELGVSAPDAIRLTAANTPITTP